MKGDDLRGPDNPFLALIVEALNLMHPRFAAASPAREFYHQLRRLWDKALPVQLGLGHILIRDEPGQAVLDSCSLFWQLGEHGQPDRRLGAVSVAMLSDPAAVASEFERLAQLRQHGYPQVVCVLMGHAAELPGNDDSRGAVVRIFFDTDRWIATLIPDSAHS